MTNYYKKKKKYEILNKKNKEKKQIPIYLEMLRALAKKAYNESDEFNSLKAKK